MISSQAADILLKTTPGAADGAEESIPSRFAAQAALHADRPAVVTDALQWSYADLDRASDLLAGQLREFDGARGAAIDAAAEPPVALLMEHDAPLIGAILAALKFGRPYVALDPADLPARREAVCQASGATLLIVNPAHRDEGRRLTQSRGRLIVTGNMTAGNGEISRARCDDPPPAITPDAPAEITFTSGTTGQPKGVARSHRTLLHHCQNYARMADISPADRISLLTPCCLGAAMSSLWGALLNGAALLPFDLRTQGLGPLPDWARRQRITLLHCVPCAFRTLAAALSGHRAGQVLQTLRLLRLGGEPVYASDLELFHRHTPPSASLLITYSTTETCTISALRLGHGSVMPEARAVGRPVAGVTVAIVDHEGNPLPTGEVGRIQVSSRYLSLGYWREPQMTAERFDIDGSDPRVRVYDTGDLGRLDAAGALEHHGRDDGGVKVLGRRVDVGEVEAALLALDGIREVAVVGRQDKAGRLNLVAYVSYSAGAFAGEAAIRGALQQLLPGYLVPSRFIRMDDFPRTAGGKIKRSALPQPQDSIRTAADSSAPPEQTTMEEQVSAIWQETLGCGPIGREDDFFAALGANSLQAADVLACLERAVGRHISATALMQHPTVPALSAYLRGQLTAPGGSALTQVQRGEEGRRPLFFLHGDIYGAGIYCHGLARQLGAALPFYSLAPLGIENWPAPTTVEAMAERHLRDVRAVQPHGPYLLGGFCNGGLVAFEMARQLQRAGEEIGMLSLVRSNMMPTRWPGLRNLVDTAGELLGADEDRRLDVFAAIQTRLRNWRRASRHGLGARLRFLRELLGVLPAPARPASPPKGIPSVTAACVPCLPTSPARFRSVWMMHRRAKLRYQPRAYRGRILLFWPEQDDALLYGDRTAGWNRVASQVVPHRIPGSHTTCITHHCDQLAAILRPYLVM